MIEDDAMTIYNNISPTSRDTSEHLEDALTLPDNDHSEIDTVYHYGRESLDINWVTSLNGDCDHIKDQITLEITVNVESAEIVENLRKLEDVQKSLNLMKEPLYISWNIYHIQKY